MQFRRKFQVHESMNSDHPSSWLAKAFSFNMIIQLNMCERLDCVENPVMIATAS